MGLKMSPWESIPGETPIDDFSELKVKGIFVRRDLNQVEADNTLKVTDKYLSEIPSNEIAPFTFL